MMVCSEKVSVPVATVEGMADRSHLTPVPTVDKNGRVTTVYRKPSAAVQGPAVPRVAAVTVKSSQREELITALVDRWDPSRYNEDKRHEIAEHLRGYSDELLEMLNSMDKSNKTARHSASRGVPENEVREELCFFPYLRGRAYHTARMLIRSLHDYPAVFSSEDFSLEDEETKIGCRALLRVTDLMLDHGDDENFMTDDLSSFALRDEELVALVVNSGDRSDQVVEFIRDRLVSGAGTVNAPLIEEMLASDVSAISSGVL
jgi:hypothetical protein